MSDPTTTADTIRAAECVLPSAHFDADLEYFTASLGFRIESIFPADNPAVATLFGYGVRLRLERRAPEPSDPTDHPGQPLASVRLRLHVNPAAAAPSTPAAVTSPGGTAIDFVEPEADLGVPPLAASLVVNRAARTDPGPPWVTGRAGMQYRDLIPDRWGGRFIASHIRIPNGGPVPDYVHYHKVRFQMILCFRGWVQVVYEDQGPAFVMRAGDCVLQPPQIRHRVLTCSDGLEVVEIGCPAAHQTWAEHGFDLPTEQYRPTRDFGGQRFVRHQADQTPWRPWDHPGFEYRDLGIAAATGTLAGARVIRTIDQVTGRFVPMTHTGEFLFVVVRRGELELNCDDRQVHLGPEDCFALPAGLDCTVRAASSGLEMLEVRLPAATCTGAH